MYNKLDIAPLEEFLTKEVSPQSMAQAIERVVFEYSRLLLLDADSCGARQQEAEDIYWLNEHRKLLELMKNEE